MELNQFLMVAAMVEALMEMAEMLKAVQAQYLVVMEVVEEQVAL
jgi:hypothetical protein